MLQVRNRRWLIWGLPTVIAAVAANHIEGFVHDRARDDLGGLNVQVEALPGTRGHNTIGIDEQALARNGARHLLQFATLGQWAYARDAPTSCPEPIRRLSGSEFNCVGFMYPLQTGATFKTFCLLRSTQTCCYGPRPQYNQYLLVEMKQPVKFERLTPVLVRGRFFVDPSPSEGFIYRIEGESLTPIEGDVPETDPVSASKQAKLPLFDYGPLEAMADGNGTVPKALTALAGRTVVVAGYCVGRTSDQPPRLMVAHAWWDGVAQGVRPTIHNTLIVAPRDSAQVPPLWKPYQTFTGTLALTQDRSSWGREGIVQLRDAQLGVPGVTPPIRGPRTGPLIPVPFEALVVVLVALCTLRFRPQAGSVPGHSPLTKG